MRPARSSAPPAILAALAATAALAAQYTRFDVAADTKQNDGALLRAGLVFGFDR